jgi:lipoate-protein ligase A
MFFRRNFHFKLIKNSFRTKCEIFVSKSNNIVYNLAVEEFFFEHREINNPILFLYQNSKTVVIGTNFFIQENIKTLGKNVIST